MTLQEENEAFKNEPLHVFCDTTHTLYNKETFLFVARSGKEVYTLAFSPGHLKRVMLSMHKVVAAYEQQYGEIDVNTQPGPMVSPIQPTDLEG